MTTIEQKAAELASEIYSIVGDEFISFPGVDISCVLERVLTEARNQGIEEAAKRFEPPMKAHPVFAKMIRQLHKPERGGEI